MFKDSQLREFLQAHFPYSDFRGVQEEVLAASIKGESVLALMPTGGGKSLIYQYLAKKSDQPVIVVSPLIALMEDQVRKAQHLGIRSTYLSSLIGSEEREKRLREVESGQIQLFFVTPERLRKPEFIKRMGSLRWSTLVVDEAHCISQWGHDFRPDYSRISEFWEVIQKPPLLALTATATPAVQKDILESLRFSKGARIFTSGVRRPNLELFVHDVFGAENKNELLHQFIKEENDGITLVYFSLIQTLLKASSFLRENGIQHLLYHGDLEGYQRRKNQKIFESLDKGIMLATPAFGLGIDKSNIRRLVHYELPGSLESYFQEVGRAGRDGQKARADLLFDEEDVSIQMEFQKWANPDREFMLSLMRLIQTQALRVSQQGFDFLREQMNFKNRRDFRVEAAVNIFEKAGVLERVQEGSTQFPYILNEGAEEKILGLLDPQVLLKNHQMKLLQLVQWAKNSEDCRILKIYKYFGDDGDEVCGICDVCRSE